MLGRQISFSMTASRVRDADMKLGRCVFGTKCKFASKTGILWLLVLSDYSELDPMAIHHACSIAAVVIPYAAYRTENLHFKL